MEGLGFLQVPLAVGAMQLPSAIKSIVQQKQAHETDMMLKQKEMESQVKFMDNLSKEISTW